MFRCSNRFNRPRKGPLQSYSTQIHLKMLKIWCNTSNFFICTGMCTKNTSCGPRRHLNDVGFVLLMPQGNSMHVVSSFGLGCWYGPNCTSSRPKRPISAQNGPQGAIWACMATIPPPNAPKVSAHLKIIIRWCRLVNRVVLR